MNVLPFISAAAPDSSPTAIYVVVAGAVCTGLGWWLRGRIQETSGSGEPSATPAPDSAEPAGKPAEEAGPTVPAAEADGWRKERDAALEKCTALLQQLETAQLSLKSASEAGTAAESRANTLAKDLARAIEAASSPEAPAGAQITAALQRELDSLREQTSGLESALAQAKSELQNVTRELAEKSAALTVSVPAAEATALNRRIGELEGELARLREAQAIQPQETPAVQPAAAPPETQDEVESLRSELQAAKAEIRKMKAQLSAPKPRPILTSPRPDGGRPPGA